MRAPFFTEAGLGGRRGAGLGLVFPAPRLTLGSGLVPALLAALLPLIPAILARLPVLLTLLPAILPLVPALLALFA